MIAMATSILKQPPVVGEAKLSPRAGA